MNCRGFGRKCVWPVLRYYSSIYWEELEEPQRNLE
jgi:hypothetical protein